MTHLKYYLLLIFVLIFNLTLKGQTQKRLYGDTIYIKYFCKDARQMGLEDMRVSSDSLKIRIWNAGKLVELTYYKDSISGYKNLYMYTNPSRKRQISKSGIVYETMQLSKNSIQIIDSLIYDIKKLTFEKYKYNTDSLFRRDGGVAKGIEYSKKSNYLLLTETIWDSQIEKIVDQVTDTLNMTDEYKLFYDNLPKGAWYSWGYTTSVYKLTFMGSLIHRITFWK